VSKLDLVYIPDIMLEYRRFFLISLHSSKLPLIIDEKLGCTAAAKFNIPIIDDFMVKSYADMKCKFSETAETIL
jgi:hypothetical protein